MDIYKYNKLSFAINHIIYKNFNKIIFVGKSIIGKMSLMNVFCDDICHVQTQIIVQIIIEFFYNKFEYLRYNRIKTFVL